MRIVLDTNCLILILAKKGSFYSIYEKIQLGSIQLIITNEILNEYEEVLEKIYSHEVADYVAKALLNHSSTIIIDRIYYQWNLIPIDEDDNKFVDAYVIGSGDYLVTNDKHFNVLKTIDFPSINLINLIDFLQKTQSNSDLI
jgi:putative PIN family toxin of toxin-antitoxin system